MRFDVVYRINGASDLRGIRLCLEHMAELRELDKRGGLAELDAKEIA